MSSNKVIVLRRHNDMNLPVLRSHGSNVTTATFDVSAYLSVKPEADDVKLKYDLFETACVAAANGGKTLNQMKDKRKEEFLGSLDALGTALQLNVGDDLTFITNAYYEYRLQPVKSDGPLPDPNLLYVKAGALLGTVEGKLVNLPKGVRTVALEYSNNDGLTWRNGTYTTGKKFTISGLISRTEILVRAIYHGTFQRSSNPSAPVPVFVL